MFHSIQKIKFLYIILTIAVISWCTWLLGNPVFKIKYMIEGKHRVNETLHEIEGNPNARETPHGIENNSIARETPHGIENNSIVRETPHGIQNNSIARETPHGIENNSIVRETPHGIENNSIVRETPQNSVYTVGWFNPPFILVHNPHILNSGFESCHYSNCRLRLRKPNVRLNDAVIFKGRDVQPRYFFPKKPGQIWVFAEYESPVHYHFGGNHWKGKNWSSSFNWTMTYDKSNTDIHWPYGEIRELPDGAVVRRNFSALYSSKTKMGLIVQSNCNTQSDRKQFLKVLAKHIEFDHLGACGTPWKCGRRDLHDKCFDVINDYKFYFAFENSICDQYITEKLFDNFNYDTIMVVRGGRNNDTQDMLPGGTYISTSDFKSIKELTDYLKKVASSEELYTGYLKRKSRYFSVPYKTVYRKSLCGLCERMNNQDTYRKQIYDIEKWAFSRNPCQSPTDLNET